MDKSDEQHLLEYRRELQALNYRVTVVTKMIKELEAMEGKVEPMGQQS